ncbi:TetR/AcrR family transcriptional regulator [uncultured Microscilla sp.]|uniref:TetR/AcrR family transcriptional regulator n=1 Tax=uncultured Microscilla sp. TaxID=432653 RepID=UPI0026178875|nr:TetR/AcrR family transcriptional regulator [uncultured Microscilla sp.]
MPKTAFWKLPFAKQNHFIETSIEEFSNQSYENVSVKYISQQIGIAKGTLYKYFENKKDLYLFLVEYAITKKYQTIDRLLQQSSDDELSEVLLQIYTSTARFEVDFPVLSRFLYCVHREHPHHELGNLPQLLKKQACNHYRAILHDQQQKGNVRSDIPLEMLTFLVVQLGWGIRDYFLNNHPSAFIENENSKSKTGTSLREVAHIFASQLTLLVNEGIA